jgi:glycosyltransferase involved in cell wall biosynthesis
MKILLAVHHFPPSFTGGAEWEAYRIAYHLMNRSHQVRVLCVEQVTNSHKNIISWKDDFYKGIPVRRLFLTMNFTYGEFTRFEFDNPLIAEHIKEFLQEYCPDIFHLISGYLMTGSSLRVIQEKGIPTILSLMDFWFLCRRITLYRSDGRLSRPPIQAENCVQCIGEEKTGYNFLGKMFPNIMAQYWKGQKSHIRLFEDRRLFLINTLNNVNVIISRSRFMKEIYEKEGVDPERIILSRQGLDIGHFQNNDLDDIRHNEKLRIGYSGQIAPVKGVHLLIKAVKLIRDPRLEVKIYGNETSFPKYTEQLKQMAKNDSRIQFAGMFSREDLVNVMKNLDVLVVPSVWYENSPNVILEAFATHTPVIASDMGGMAELVKHQENGLLFKLGDAEALAEQLSLLIDDPTLLRRLRSGIEPVKSIENEIDDLEKILYSLVGRSTRGDKKTIFTGEPGLVKHSS